MKHILTLTALLALTGCAAMGEGYRPLVDRPGPNFEADLADCQLYAQGEVGAVDGGASGAVLGALFSLAVSAALGAGTDSQTAIAGAIGGGVGGLTSAAGNQRDVIRRCMMGRGYNVLR